MGESLFRNDEGIWAVPYKLTKQLRVQTPFEKTMQQFVNIEPVQPEGVGIGSNVYVRFRNWAEADPSACTGIAQTATGPGYVPTWEKQTVTLAMTAFYFNEDEETIRRASESVKSELVEDLRTRLDELQEKELIYLAKTSYLKAVPNVSGADPISWDTYTELDDLLEGMDDDYRIPKLTDGQAAYNIVSGWKFLNRITNASAYISWNQFKRPDLSYYHQMGITEGFNLFHTNQVSTKTASYASYKINNNAGTNTISEAIAFGKDAFGEVVGWPEEIRSGYSDPPFNLSYVVFVWKLHKYFIPWGITNQGTVGKSRVVHITSA